MTAQKLRRFDGHEGIDAFAHFRNQPFIGLAAVIVTTPSLSLASTRLVDLDAKNQVVTARSMDWRFEMPTHLWIFPIAAAYEVSTSDGMNHAGVVANVLWLAESPYPKFDSSKPGLSIAAWAQYVLDNFATVQEAVAVLEKDPLAIFTENGPAQQLLTTLHLSLSDASGDSAIIHRRQSVIHHDRKYQVIPITRSSKGNWHWTNTGRRSAAP